MAERFDTRARPEHCSTVGCTNPVQEFIINGNVFYAPLCSSCQQAISEQAERDELAQARVIERHARANRLRIPMRFWDEGFDTFAVEDGNRDAYLEARRFADEFDQREGGLLLLGDVGCGKTHLAAAILAQVGVGLMVNQFELMEDAQRDYNRDWEESEDLMGRSMEVPLLIIDDLGCNMPNLNVERWVSDILYRISNTRWERHLPTVVTANLTMNDLTKRYGERVISRLCSGATIVTMGGRDRRMPGNG